MNNAERTPLTKERLAETREWAQAVKSEPLAYPKSQHLLNDVIAELDAECAAHDKTREELAACIRTADAIQLSRNQLVDERDKLREELASAKDHHRDYLIRSAEELIKVAKERNSLREVNAALAGTLTDVAQTVCGYLCPSTWRTADGPPPHDKRCQAVKAAMALAQAANAPKESTNETPTT